MQTFISPSTKELFTITTFVVSHYLAFCSLYFLYNLFPPEESVVLPYYSGTVISAESERARDSAGGGKYIKTLFLVKFSE